MHHYVNIVLSLSSLVILMSLLFSTRHKTAINYTTGPDEYDFMACESSLQSRLDLAMTYLEMEQSPQALKILKELSTCGNPNIEAQAMQELSNNTAT